MNRRPLPYDELTPLEQCIANKYLFARLLEGEEIRRHEDMPVRDREPVAH